MECIVLPNTDLRASRICLGTAEYGSSISRDDSFGLMDAFLDAGGNFLDTAHVYADWQCDTPGMSERTIGEWVVNRGCRDRVIIATKGGHPGPTGPRLAPDQIYSNLKESLRRLRMQQVDLYWLHRDDPALPVDQILDTLERARGEGLIRYYGASNWSVARLREAAAYAHHHGFPGFVASQIQWSLADIRPECIPDPTTVAMDRETFTYHKETGMPVVPFSSQAAGFFSGKYVQDQPESGRPEVRRMFDTDQNWSRLERARRLASELGCSANEICLAYLIAQPFPTFPIVGAHRLEQLVDSCRAADLHLTPEQVDYLECG